MATSYITGKPKTVLGQPGDVDTTARNPVGTRAPGTDYMGNSCEFIYLLGVASTIAGSVVTFDEAGVTALIVANGKGPVAVALGAYDSTSKWGWYGIQGTWLTDVVANCADNATMGRETTDGKIGDNRAAGDQIANCFSRGSTGGAAALTPVQFDHSYVDDFMGA